jgi:hypothetical protein
VASGPTSGGGSWAGPEALSRRRRAHREDRGARSRRVSGKRRRRNRAGVAQQDPQLVMQRPGVQWHCPHRVGDDLLDRRDRVRAEQRGVARIRRDSSRGDTGIPPAAPDRNGEFLDVDTERVGDKLRRGVGQVALTLGHVLDEGPRQAGGPSVGAATSPFAAKFQQRLRVHHVGLHGLIVAHLWPARQVTWSRGGTKRSLPATMPSRGSRRPGREDDRRSCLWPVCGPSIGHREQSRRAHPPRPRLTRNDQRTGS